MLQSAPAHPKEQIQAPFAVQVPCEEQTGVPGQVIVAKRTIEYSHVVYPYTPKYHRATPGFVIDKLKFVAKP
jgi:hypothetical protein